MNEDAEFYKKQLEIASGAIEEIRMHYKAEIASLKEQLKTAREEAHKEAWEGARKRVIEPSHISGIEPYEDDYYETFEDWQAALAGGKEDE